MVRFTLAALKSKRRGNQSRESILRSKARSSARRQAVRRGVTTAVVALLGVAAIGAALWWGGQAAWQILFTENEFFLIRDIEVTTDGALTMQEILDAAQVSKGQNLFAVRPDAIREALLGKAMIASAQVGRRLPDTLLIEVGERVAVARLGRSDAGSPLAVDLTGHVLGPSSVRASLPVILGVRDKGLKPGDVVQDPMLAEALQVLEICNLVAMRQELTVATIEVGHPDRLTVGLTTGETVLLSRNKLREKLDRLRAMRIEARRRGLDLAVYDMTVDRNFVGRPATGAPPAAAAAPAW